MNQPATSINSGKPNPTLRYHCKKAAQNRNECLQLKSEKQQFEGNITIAGDYNNGTRKHNPNENKHEREPTTVYPPCGK